MDQVRALLEELLADESADIHQFAAIIVVQLDTGRWRPVVRHLLIEGLLAGGSSTDGGLCSVGLAGSFLAFGYYFCLIIICFCWHPHL